MTTIDSGAILRRSILTTGRRILVTLVTWLGVLVPVFLLATFFTFLLRDLSGLNPVYVVLGDNPSPEAAAALTEKWGLDQPLLVRYVDWFGGILHGDLGQSWLTSGDIADTLVRRAGISLSIAAVALAIGVGVGTLLGVLAATYQGSALDRGITVFTTAVSVLPAFIMGIAFILVFAVTLRVLPSAGYVPPEAGIGLWLSHIILPATALSLDLVADVARQLRTGILGTRRENYLLGATLNGYSGARRFWAYSFRNSVGPTLTVVGLKLPTLIGGAVITEAIFGIPGLGMYAAETALAGDVPAVQGVLVISIIVVVVFNFIVNSLLNVLTPAAKRGA